VIEPTTCRRWPLAPGLNVFALYSWLPGGLTLKGTTWGAILWLIAQLVVMPLMGAGLFSAATGGMMAAAGSLVAHLIYGSFPYSEPLLGRRSPAVLPSRSSVLARDWTRGVGTRKASAF
jgi:hypothetical protein